MLSFTAPSTILSMPKPFHNNTSILPEHTSSCSAMCIIKKEHFQRACLLSGLYIRKEEEQICIHARYKT